MQMRFSSGARGRCEDKELFLPERIHHFCGFCACLPDVAGAPRPVGSRRRAGGSRAVGGLIPAGA